MQMTSWGSPWREYGTIAVLAAALLVHLFITPLTVELLTLAGVGVIPIAIRAGIDVAHRRITMDVFNVFVVGVSIGVNEAVSAAFIMLMITSADALEWHTEHRTQHAVERLLKLKPQTALLKHGDAIETVPIAQINVGDIVVVESGQSISADGIVVQGRALVNESLVTGESVPVEKVAGSRVLVSTVVDVGAIQVRATHVGKDSTIERMAELMRSAITNKSKPERLADRFASVFMPAIILFGVGVYLVTRNLSMTAALFMVACTDDIAVAVPLAMTASLGWAAKRGVIIKGGVWLDAIAQMQTLVLDKTGTLTYGAFRLDRIALEPGVSEQEFWKMVGIAEKFSEHPIGRALFMQARTRVGDVHDPDDTTVYKSAGIVVKIDGHTVAVGDEKLLDPMHIDGQTIRDALAKARKESVGTSVFVARDGALQGVVSLADAPRPEAAHSLRRVRELGAKSIIMFTGDTEQAAQRVAEVLEIPEVRAGMSPEGKLQALERLPHHPVVMVGDGVNDAPVLARADVGIAMGKHGTAIASEAADIIILTDNLDRIADIVLLGRRTKSVIHGDIWLWTITNAAGYVLVLTGVFGPALAAFYNFATDFIPIINSTRLFRGRTVVP